MKTLILQESQFHQLLSSNTIEKVYDENIYMLRRTNSTKDFENDDFKWILVAIKTQSTSHKCYRKIKYIGSPEKDDVLFTNVNFYNLNRTSSSICKLDENFDIAIENLSYEFAPKYATNAKIAIVNSYRKIDVSIIDICLQNYFLESKYLHSGDLFCVNILKYVPEIVYNDLRNSQIAIYFKVESIEGPSYPKYENEVTYGYLVNNKHTTVYQVSSTQCFIPSCEFDQCDVLESIESFEHRLYSIIPDGMNEIYERLEELILPFLRIKKEDIKLSSIFLLSGKSGTGKSTLLSALARKQGLHYCPENCTLIQNSNPAQTESIINNIFSKITNSSPCILHFRYIEALCEDESGNKDDRTVECFIKNVKSLQVLPSNYPVIIFCSTSQESKLIPSLQRIFLQTIKTETLNYECRHSILRWILKKENLETEDLDDIARSSSNFVFSDLIQLVSRALKISCTRLRSDEQKMVELSKNYFIEALAEMNDAFADAIGAPEVPNVTWEDIGGLSHLKEEILSSLLKPVLSNGLRRSGLLLHGPPGTGKTLLAKAVATECKYNFLSVKGPELLNMYVGQSEKNVREVFSRARESAPCVVFFDELDSLAPKRGQSGGSGSVMDRVVSQLLAEMDGIQRSSGIFILAATNRPDLIDSALLRPGRLDKMLYVGSCKDKESKLAVLKALTRKFTFTRDVNLEKLVSLLPLSSEITGADLYGICSNAWLSAARRHIKLSQINDGATLENFVSVCTDDMMNAISQFNVKDLSSD